MIYPTPPGQRFGYDIDGSIVLVNGAAASGAQRRALNNEDDDVVFSALDGTITIVFPQPREVDAWFMALTASDAGYYGVLYSTNTTDGIDGTWGDPGGRGYANNNGHTVRPAFRQAGYAGAPSPGLAGGFSLPWSSTLVMKAIRFLVGPSAWAGLGLGDGTPVDIRAIHLYGGYSTSSSDTLGLSSTGPNIVGLSRGDTWIPDGGISASRFGGGVVTNVKITAEVLTEPAGRTLSEQLFALTGLPLAGSAQIGPATYDFTAGPLGCVPLIAVAPDADLGGPWCFRVRVDGDGVHSYVEYFYVDEINASDPVYTMFFRKAPSAGLIAGISTVTVLARGVGATQAARGAVLHLFGISTPGYDSGPITPVSWTPVGADSDAYTSAREISVSTVDVDHVAITFVVPTDAIGQTVGLEIDVAGTQFGYTPAYTTDYTLTVTDTSYLSGSAATTDTSAGGAVVLRQDAEPVNFDPTNYGYGADELLDTTLYPPTPMVQRHFRRTGAPYAVVDGIAVDPPLLGAMSKSVAYARSWSATEHLGAELGLGLMGATARWLPDPADISGHNWHPHFGAAPNLVFSALGSTIPYVDPDYEYYARREALKTVQAMIFDGTSWAVFGGPSAQQAFSWVIVAVLHHPANRSHYDILASPSTATDPDRATDTTLRYNNGAVHSLAGAKLSSGVLHPPTYKGRTRPVILAWSEGAHGGTLGVVDGLGRHWQDFAHGNKASFDLRMKLGMNGAVNDTQYAAEMDVLDILYWDVRHTRVALGSVVTKLDGVYGVTGR